MLYKWGVIGHETQLSALENDIKSGNLAHAYLFSGPEKVGKFTVAKKLAHILQCPDNYCYTCNVCKQIEKGGHSDTIQLRGDDEAIKIEQIRDIIARLNMTANSNHKIVLAEDIERMTPEAANCLLKTLEEPPPKVVFICTTTNIREVLPTIVSRMRVLRFRNFSEKFLINAMTKEFPDTDTEAIEQVCSLAMGKSGQAFKLLRDGELLSHYRTLYNDILRLLETETVSERFSYIQGIYEDPKLTRDFLDVLLHVLRSRMLSEHNIDKIGRAHV